MNYEKNSIRNNSLHHRQHDDWDEVHNQLLAIQKKSLEVSNPNDADEQEADEVARKVSDGESAQIHGTGGAINRKGSGSAETTNEFQTKLESKKGAGQKLDESTRSEMESKMGADFSRVNIHIGSEAHNMSESINAKAFTHGQDVFFKDGEFDTSSKQGKELLAHELTHTVQQQHNVLPLKINRKIRIAGVEQKYTEDELSKSEILRKMNSSPMFYDFKDKTQFDEAMKQRQSVINTMLTVMKPSDAVVFGGEQGFRLPEDAWDKIDGIDGFTLKKNVKPSYAIKRIFENTNKQTVLDCNMMIVAIHYKSMLDAVGDDTKFDALFPGGQGLIISQMGISYKKEKGFDYPVESGKHPFEDKQIFDEDAIKTFNIIFDPADPGKDLIPGDWVYFSNVDGTLGYKGIEKIALEMLSQFAQTGEGMTLQNSQQRLGETIDTYGRNIDLNSSRILAYQKANKKVPEKLLNENKLLLKEYDQFVDKLIKINQRLWPTNLRSNAWQGEHAVYLGNNLFGGFGVRSEIGFDYKAMQQKLFNNYMNVVNDFYNHEYWQTFSGNKVSEKEKMQKMTLETLDATLTQPQIIKVRRLDYSKMATLGKK
ncbi:MAG TPA: DUF4157 domain-containing protein [Bacteroidia bacterium]|nr:DUF4157 domain-containing protein [Bacteroidia bacterium]